jgi:hypothetical protein
MRTIVPLLAITILSFVSLQQVHASTVINFDSYHNTGGPGDFKGDEYVGQGIIFSTDPADSILGLGGSTGSKPNCLGSYKSGSPYNGPVFFEFTNNQIAKDLRFWGVHKDYEMHAIGFDINDNKIRELNLVPPSRIVDFSGIPIHRVEVTGRSMCIDDVVFTLEPGPQMDNVIGGKLIPVDTIALLLAGTLSFSWMIPIVLSTVGIGMFAVSRKSENS